MTAAVWSQYVKVPDGVELQDEQGRLWDILWMFRFFSSRFSGAEVLFKLHVRNTNRRGTPPLVTLKGCVGPGDNGEWVATIMLPEED